MLLSVIAHDEISQGFALHFCILQAIKNWSQGRLGSEAAILLFLTQVFQFGDHVVGEIESVQQLKMTKVFNLVD